MVVLVPQEYSQSWDEQRDVCVCMCLSVCLSVSADKAFLKDVYGVLMAVWMLPGKAP